MPKTTKTTYFAPISFGAGGCWGAGDTPEQARDRACKEAMRFAAAFGGFKKDARLTINVYAIRPGCYAHQDERGLFEVDYDTDEIVAFAKVCARFVDVPPRQPNRGAIGAAVDAYSAGSFETIDRANAERVEPIGRKVA